MSQGHYDCITAIKIDEGVDIPSVETAIIGKLWKPETYIQRKGAYYE